MFYYCYKIILTAGTLRGKYYIGKRIYRGKDINKDPYKGSGRIITNYYKRFPNAYQKIILATCTNADELSKLEYKLRRNCLILIRERNIIAQNLEELK